MVFSSASRSGVSAQPIELRTPWSSINPADRSIITERIKQRKPVVAYAPGLVPQQQAREQSFKTFHQVAEEPPPLPPTQISIPGIHVTRTQEAPVSMPERDQPVTNQAIPNAASGLQEFSSASTMKKTTANTASSSSLSGNPAPDDIMHLFQSRGGTSSQGNKPLGSRESFGSPTSLAEAISSNPQSIATSMKPQERDPEPQSSSVGLGAHSGSGLHDTGAEDGPTVQVSSMLGSPAMHRTTMTLSSPATSVQQTRQPLPSVQGFPTDIPQMTQSPTRLFNAPSPFASGVPEGASDILPPGSPGALSFSNIGFGGQGGSTAATPETLAFGVPSPQQNAQGDAKNSASPNSPFPPYGATAGSAPQQTQLSNSGALFAKFSQQAKGQGTLFGAPPQNESAPTFALSQQPPSPVGAQSFGQMGLPSPAIGGGFGAPAVLGAGGVANNLGSLQGHTGGGYASMSGSGNAFANLAPQAMGGTFGNQPNIGGMSGPSQAIGSGGGGGGFTSFASNASAFGAMASGNNTTFGGGFGGSGGQPLFGGSGVQSGTQQDSTLWKPRR